MTAQFDTAAFANAYLAGNEAAQAMPDDMGLFQMADAAGYDRDTPAWQAYVSGGAAFIFNGHTFKTKAAA